jgi:hypothetical protein
MSTVLRISDDVVEATWQEITGLQRSGIRSLQRRSGKLQEELMAFLIAFVIKQRRGVVEVALHMAIAILEMFQRTSARKLRRVKEDRIIQILRENREFVAHLPDSIEIGATMLVDPEIVSEPAIMRYVVFGLAGLSEDSEESFRLSNDEFWFLVVALKTFTDALHEAAQFEENGEPKRSPRRGRAGQQRLDSKD